MAVPEPVAENQVVRPNLPPLRIHHFLVCGVVAAVLFTIWRSQLRPENWKLVDAASPARLALFATSQIVQAAALTLVGFSVYWHLKGYAALRQPGQWLPFAISFSAFRTLAMPLIGPILVESPWQKNVFLWDGSDLLAAVVYFLAGFTYSILPILFFGWLTWRVADTLWWRTLFALKAVGAALRLFSVAWLRWFGLSTGDAWMLVASVASFGVTACAVLAAIHDRRCGIERPWTHWLGVGLFLGQLALNLLTYGFYHPL